MSSIVSAYATEPPGIIYQSQVSIITQSLTQLSIAYQQPENTGGLPILAYWVTVSNDQDNFNTESVPFNNGVLLTYTQTIIEPGNEGTNYRFKIAA